ncbi:MAG TPA: GNAT family N-acetyltransferase [Candidatus Limnocylindrales bacterium]|nr:GNAT family N-acetyltransferase [Candidatus Limnocylindrales bacterium]
MEVQPEPVRPFPAPAGLVLPPGLVVRHPRRPGDYPEMNRVANRLRQSLGDAFYTTVEQLASYYETPGPRFDTDRDVAIIEAEDRFVGYARTGIETRVDGIRVLEIVPFLDPEADLSLVFPAVLAILEHHARELAAADPAPGTVLETFGGDRAPEREAMIQAAGYVPIRHGYSMVRPTLDDLPDATLPEGLEIREVRPEHLRAIWDAGTEAFRDMWGWTEPSAADYARFLDEEAADTTLWRVAWDGDAVAGQVRSFINEEENAATGRLRGYTEAISVRRPYRRRGLARALIAASFPLLRARGMTEAALGVDTENVSGALRVYERCGYRPVSRSTTYRKPLD